MSQPYPCDLEQLDALIALLNETASLSPEQKEYIWEENAENRRKVIERMFVTGDTYGVASGAPAFFNQSEEQFFAYIKSIDNDLEAHVKIVTNAFHLYLKTVEIPAPYYPWRIAVILSKRKMKDREKNFLTGWCRHFGDISDRAGVKYGKLVERARKMGVQT